MHTLTILGSTGSIGENTLDVVARHPDRFRIFALAGHRQTEKLARQCRQFSPRYAAVADTERAAELAGLLRLSGCRTEVLHGGQALCDLASADETDGVMCAIVGAAGLPSALAAARSGKTVYLANKETLVVSGSLFTEAARQGGARVLPVDSEHNAVFQALPPDYFENGLPPAAPSLAKHGIRSLILTASGGPFRGAPLAGL